MRRLTVTLSAKARKRIDEKAAQLGLSRSAFVERLIAADAKAELERDLEDGYRATQDQNLDFAERAGPLVWGVVGPDDLAW